MGRPSGFDYNERSDSTVVITHNGRHATTLRHARAAEFLREVEGQPDRVVQDVMARWTGNYKRGNERQARQHPRNRRR